jgi:tRNA modification GTPase
VDEDIEFISHGDVLRQLDQAVGDTADVRRQMTTRGAAAGEPRAVLVGRPNVGKSSLMNALAGDRAALVDPVPGTTRDYLSRRLDLEGLGCVVIDTAGVSDQAGQTAIDTAAQQVTAEQSRQSDIHVICLDATRSFDAWEQQQLTSVRNEEDCLVVLTKCDLLAGRQPPPGCPAAAVFTSSKTGAGVDKLCQEIRRRAEEFLQPETNVVAGTAVRCQESLRLAEESLERARDVAAHGGGDELVAAEVRTALSELGKVVGAVYTDDVLDRVFSRFCIGK